MGTVEHNMPGTTSALISAALGVLLVCGVVFVALPNDSHNQSQPTTPTSLSSTNKAASTVLQGPDGTSYTLSFLHDVSVESPGYTMLPAPLRHRRANVDYHFPETFFNQTAQPGTSRWHNPNHHRPNRLAERSTYPEQHDVWCRGHDCGCWIPRPRPRQRACIHHHPWS